MQTSIAPNEEKKDLFTITHAFKPVKHQPPPITNKEKLDISAFLEQSIEKYLGQADNATPKEEEKQITRSKSNVLAAMTERLLDLYKKCSKDFKYEKSMNPKQELTYPCEGVYNDNYDNVENDYILKINDTIATPEGQEYIIEDLVGKGTFGQVVRCENMVTKERVAIKVIKNKPAYQCRGIVEVKILHQLKQIMEANHNENLFVKMIDYFVFRNHLCIVFELLGASVFDLIKQNNFKGLSLNLSRLIISQILESQIVLKELGIIHCDLKPENLLLISNSSVLLKVIDLGSACYENHTVFSYIQSRFYRAPEILFGLPYSSSIDLWSLGCICAELFLGLPIFPGNSEYDQIAKIISIMGMPPVWMIERAKHKSKYFTKDEEAEEYRLKTVEEFEREQNVKLEKSKTYFEISSLDDLRKFHRTKKNQSDKEKEAEQNALESFINFLKGLIKYDPNERWTATVATQHPFITREKYVEGQFKPILEEDLSPRSAEKRRKIKRFNLGSCPSKMQNVLHDSPEHPIPIETENTFDKNSCFRPSILALPDEYFKGFMFGKLDMLLTPNQTSLVEYIKETFYPAPQQNFPPSKLQGFRQGFSLFTQQMQQQPANNQPNIGFSQQTAGYYPPQQQEFAGAFGQQPQNYYYQGGANQGYQDNNAKYNKKKKGKNPKAGSWNPGPSVYNYEHQQQQQQQQQQYPQQVPMSQFYMNAPPEISHGFNVGQKPQNFQISLIPTGDPQHSNPNQYGYGGGMKSGPGTQKQEHNPQHNQSYQQNPGHGSYEEGKQHYQGHSNQKKKYYNKGNSGGKYYKQQQQQQPHSSGGKDYSSNTYSKKEFNPKHQFNNLYQFNTNAPINPKDIYAADGGPHQPQIFNQQNQHYYQQQQQQHQQQPYYGGDQYQQQYYPPGYNNYYYQDDTHSGYYGANASRNRSNSDLSPYESPQKHQGFAQYTAQNTLNPGAVVDPRKRSNSYSLKESAELAKEIIDNVKEPGVTGMPVTKVPSKDEQKTPERMNKPQFTFEGDVSRNISTACSVESTTESSNHSKKNSLDMAEDQSKHKKFSFRDASPKITIFTTNLPPINTTNMNVSMGDATAYQAKQPSLNQPHSALLLNLHSVQNAKIVPSPNSCRIPSTNTDKFVTGSVTARGPTQKFQPYEPFLDKVAASQQRKPKATSQSGEFSQINSTSTANNKEVPRIPLLEEDSSKRQTDK